MELGDNDVRHQRRKLIDPCLRCYIGAFFMCNSNEGLKEKGTGNGTQCRLLKAKLKESAKSYMCKIWNKRKAWSVCASDVEWVEFEHYPKTQTISNLEPLLKQKKQEQLNNPTDTRITKIEEIESKLNREVNLRKFKLSPKFFGKCKVHVSPNDFVSEKQPMCCSITQIPFISSDAITGQKLQGLTKDQLIILLEQDHELDLCSSLKSENSWQSCLEDPRKYNCPLPRPGPSGPSSVSRQP